MRYLPAQEYLLIGESAIADFSFSGDIDDAPVQIVPMQKFDGTYVLPCSVLKVQLPQDLRDRMILALGGYWFQPKPFLKGNTWVIAYTPMDHSELTQEQSDDLASALAGTNGRYVEYKIYDASVMLDCCDFRNCSHA